jgi:hypothetical protein
MDRTPKANKNWESYSDDDMDSQEQEEDQSLDQSDPSQPRTMVKRAMAEDKLQEKRLKERARRNGMASSIDEMRVLVPELIEAKKNYSQAKVVAFALAHMHELQRENDSLRERLGMPNRMDEFRARIKANGKTKKERAPAGERGRKRRRLNEDAPTSATASPVAATLASTSAPVVATVISLTPSHASTSTLPRPDATINAVTVRPQPESYTYSREASDDLELDVDTTYVSDSLAASPALSPHALDDELGPFGRNFDNFDDNTSSTHLHTRVMHSEGMDWEETFASAPVPFESFFVDH